MNPSCLLARATLTALGHYNVIEGIKITKVNNKTPPKQAKLSLMKISKGGMRHPGPKIYTIETRSTFA